MTRTEFGVPSEGRTMRTDRGIEPIPGMGVCDFCTSTPVVVAYPCGIVIFDNGADNPHGSMDPWGACQHCHDLIEADDRAGLVQRALGGFIVEHGEQPAGVLVKVGEALAEVHGAFFAARQGDAQPL